MILGTRFVIRCTGIYKGIIAPLSRGVRRAAFVHKVRGTPGHATPSAASQRQPQVQNRWAAGSDKAPRNKTLTVQILRTRSPRKGDISLDDDALKSPPDPGRQQNRGLKVMPTSCWSGRRDRASMRPTITSGGRYGTCDCLYLTHCNPPKAQCAPSKFHVLPCNA